MTKNSEPNKFFTQIEELMPTLVDKGAGKIALKLESQPIRAGRRQVRVYAPNLVPSLNFFSSVNLRNYLTQSPTSTERKALRILKKSLLDILESGGFGEVRLIFEKNKKKETIVFCELTISQKHVILSV